MSVVCGVCAMENSKYKCPQCRLPFCSLSCCKKHKETTCAEFPTSNSSVAENAENESKSITFITPDTVLESELVLLKDSKLIKDMLTNVHLRDLLLSIDQSTTPQQAMEKAMQEPLFIEFANACLDLVEPKR